jgi:hypothetical protein
MNHGTNINLKCDPNGDLTLTNDDGTITIHKDGTIAISTVAPIHLVGESLGKLDVDVGVDVNDVKRVIGTLLGRRGKKA